jgi:hypothetical protein
MRSLGKKPIAVLMFALAVVFVPPCHAEPSEAPKQYEIELLVFRNLIESDGGEAWAADYSEWVEGSPDVVQSAEAGTPAVTWLNAAHHRLAAHENTLRRSANYRPIAYLAWRQPVYDRDQARALVLPSATDASGDAYVDGSVKVAVERYLHLYLDLQLHLPVHSQEPEAMGHEIPEFRLTESRRMRSKEIHYFDHPRFGVIALITPYEPPEQEPASVGGDPSTTPQQ